MTIAVDYVRVVQVLDDYVQQLPVMAADGGVNGCDTLVPERVRDAGAHAVREYATAHADAMLDAVFGPPPRGGGGGAAACAELLDTPMAHFAAEGRAALNDAALLLRGVCACLDDDATATLPAVTALIVHALGEAAGRALKRSARRRVAHAAARADDVRLLEWCGATRGAAEQGLTRMWHMVFVADLVHRNIRAGGWRVTQRCCALSSLDEAAVWGMGPAKTPRAAAQLDVVRALYFCAAVACVCANNVAALRVLLACTRAGGREPCAERRHFLRYGLVTSPGADALERALVDALGRKPEPSVDMVLALFEALHGANGVYAGRGIHASFAVRCDALARRILHGYKGMCGRDFMADASPEQLFGWLRDGVVIALPWMLSVPLERRVQLLQAALTSECDEFMSMVLGRVAAPRVHMCVLRAAALCVRAWPTTEYGERVLRRVFIDDNDGTTALPTIDGDCRVCPGCCAPATVARVRALGDGVRGALWSLHASCRDHLQWSQQKVDACRALGFADTVLARHALRYESVDVATRLFCHTNLVFDADDACDADNDDGERGNGRSPSNVLSAVILHKSLLSCVGLRWRDPAGRYGRFLASQPHAMCPTSEGVMALHIAREHAARADDALRSAALARVDAGVFTLLYEQHGWRFCRAEDVVRFMRRAGVQHEALHIVQTRVAEDLLAARWPPPVGGSGTAKRKRDGDGDDDDEPK